MTFVFLALFACSNKSQTSTAQTSALQTTQNLCSYKDNKELCLGQMTKAIGSVPEMIYAHPMISTENSIQSYIQIEDEQLIVLSEQPIDCNKQFQVVGLLQEIDLGGAPGTRGSYKNFYFSDSTIQCL